MTTLSIFLLCFGLQSGAVSVPVVARSPIKARMFRFSYTSTYDFWMGDWGFVGPYNKDLVLTKSSSRLADILEILRFASVIHVDFAGDRRFWGSSKKHVTPFKLALNTTLKRAGLSLSRRLRRTSPRRWIGKLMNHQEFCKLRIAQLLLLGSHDAAAIENQFWFAPFPTHFIATTQNLKISEQLEAGVRFLDLRIGSSAIKGYNMVRAVHPSPASLNNHYYAPFKSIMKELRGFAKQGNELIIIRYRSVNAAGVKMLRDFEDETSFSLVRPEDFQNLNLGDITIKQLKEKYPKPVAFLAVVVDGGLPYDLRGKMWLESDEAGQPGQYVKGSALTSNVHRVIDHGLEQSKWFARQFAGMKEWEQRFPELGTTVAGMKEWEQRFPELGTTFV